MKEGYVFYTGEGYTVAPNGELLDSLQLLGFEEGANYDMAFEQLINNNPWIVENGFDFDLRLSIQTQHYVLRTSSQRGSRTPGTFAVCCSAC